MKVFSKVTLFGLVAGLLVTATGCGQEGLPAGKSPEDIITEALLNQEEVTQFVFEMEMSADLEGEVEGEMNELDGNLSISGTQNEEKMAITIGLDGMMKGDGVDGDAKGTVELRANEDGVFAKVSGVEVSEESTQQMVDMMLADYMNEWILLSFMESEELLESGEMADFDYEEGDELPFTNIQYEGTTDILGLKSYHFTADMDERMVLDMVDAGDVADTQKFLDAANMTGDVYVAVNEMMITGFGGTMNLDDPEMNGAVDVSFKINPTKSDDVETPDYKQELTEEDIAMLMFGGSMADPSAGMEMELNDSMMDDESDLSELEGMEGMEDIDLEELENMQ